MSTATTVVNLKSHRYNVYIGRSRRGQPPSKWGNPFPTGRRLDRQLAALVAGHPVLDTYSPGALIDRTAAIALYRAYLDVQLASGKLTAADFLAIQGKTLGCFCKPKDCHGDVIAEFCQWFAQHPDATAGPPGSAPKRRVANPICHCSKPPKEPTSCSAEPAPAAGL